jgi:kynurenine formamidase
LWKKRKEKKMTRKKGLLIALICVVGLVFLTNLAYADKRETTRRYGPGYEKWVGTLIPSDFEFGPGDEVGRLNWQDPAMVVKAAKLIKTGKIYDLAQTVDRNSPNWPGHPPYELITFRSPFGEWNQEDQGWLMSNNDANICFASEATIHCQHTGTHMDGLAHVVFGPAWAGYNGFSQKKILGDWGFVKTGIETVPPVFCRGILLDVAGYKGVGSLENGYEITIADVKGTMRKQGTTLKNGDAVLIRTGIGQYWPDKKKATQGPGPGWKTCKWLLDNGMMVGGTDTVAYEVGTTEGPLGTNPHPGHMVMFHHGVHILELLNLEELAQDEAYEFLFITLTNKFRGATGSNIRPIAVR